MQSPKEKNVDEIIVDDPNPVPPGGVVRPKKRIVRNEFYVIDPQTRTVEISQIIPSTAKRFSEMNNMELEWGYINIFHQDSGKEWFLEYTPSGGIPERTRFQGTCFVGGYFTNPLEKGWVVHTPSIPSKAFEKWVKWE